MEDINQIWDTFRRSTTSGYQAGNKIVSKFVSSNSQKSLSGIDTRFVEIKDKFSIFNLKELGQKGLSNETLEKFMPHIKLGIEKNGNKQIIFPLTTATGKQTGYNVGGENMDFSTRNDISFWSAKLGDNVKEIFIAQTPLEAMSYYDLNRTNLDFSRAEFICPADYMNRDIAKDIVNLYPDAKIHTVLSDGMHENLSEIRLAGAKNKIPLQLYALENGVMFRDEKKQSAFNLDYKDISLKNFEQKLGIQSGIISHKPQNADTFNQQLSNSIPISTGIKR
jgi:hypothetical protein